MASHFRTVLFLFCAASTVLQVSADSAPPKVAPAALNTRNFHPASPVNGPYGDKSPKVGLAAQPPASNGAATHPLALLPPSGVKNCPSSCPPPPVCFPPCPQPPPWWCAACRPCDPDDVDCECPPACKPCCRPPPCPRGCGPCCHPPPPCPPPGCPSPPAPEPKPCPESFPPAKLVTYKGFKAEHFRGGSQVVGQIYDTVKGFLGYKKPKKTECDEAAGTSRPQFLLDALEQHEKTVKNKALLYA